MVEQYIKVYERILRHPELTRLEALLVCEVMRWTAGCHKSSQSLAKLLKSDKRTIQRRIKSLEKRQWLTLLPDDNKQMRILYATPKEIPPGPLFDYAQKAKKAIAEHQKKEIRAMIKTTAKNLSV